MKKIRLFNYFLIFTALVFACIGTFFVHAAYAQSAGGSVSGEVSPTVIAAGFLSAAIAVGVSCIGAGIAVSHVGAAAIGALSEKPELTGRALIFVGLAEGIAIYGLIIAIMILGRLG